MGQWNLSTPLFAWVLQIQVPPDRYASRQIPLLKRVTFLLKLLPGRCVKILVWFAVRLSARMIDLLRRFAFLYKWLLVHRRFRAQSAVGRGRIVWMLQAHLPGLVGVVGCPVWIRPLLYEVSSSFDSRMAVNPSTLPPRTC